MQLSLSTADEIAALQQAQLLASLRGHPVPLAKICSTGCEVVSSKAQWMRKASC
jgi:hypothetical protein